MEISRSKSQSKSQETETETETETPLQTHLSRGLSLNPMVVSYKECLKNHAASLGGLALDGCGEFLPSPSACLKCAACSCHRNFHRREPYSPRGGMWRRTSSPSPSSTSPAESPTPQQSVYPSAPQMLMALSTGQLDENINNGRKRSRTKFTEEQKEKMYVFADKLGWKMVRASHDQIVNDFCSDVGVKRNVFKVWMHNNKQRNIKPNHHASSSSFI